MALGDSSQLECLTLDLVIKLGGAAITNKSKIETLREDALQIAADLVKRCVQAGKRVIVVHGAGSFGHQHAKQYKVNDGLTPTSGQLGFCLTRNSVTTLNRHVVSILTSVGVPAVSCSPFPAWRTTRRDVVQWPKQDIEDLLRANFVPVLHGDCVLDSHLGCCILSGDTLIQSLCKYFTVKRVIFLTDVNGIYNKPPHENGAVLIQNLNIPAANMCASDCILTSLSTQDVTGGILTKINSAASIAMLQQTRVFVARLGSAAAEKLCFDGEVLAEHLQATEVTAKV